MKKILHVSNYYFPHIGGIEQVARDCANTLKSEYEQKIICFNSENKNVTDSIDDIEVIRVGTFLKVSSQSLGFSYGKKIKELMIVYEPDIVIFHYPNPFVAHYICKYLKKKKFKLILWWHLDITKQKILATLFKNQNKKLLKYADKIVATSPNYIQGSPYLSQFKEKCVVVPCCVNEDRLRYDEMNKMKALEIKNMYKGKTICFAFGRHVEYKGISFLIKASKLLTEDYVILIGGKGPLTDTLIQEAKNDKKIIFLGKLSDEDLKATLLACDIFCFPSITKNEAFGIGLAESMYYKKPNITFEIIGSGVNYVSLNGVTGISVKNKDYHAFSQAIVSLGLDVQMQKKYGDAAYARVISYFGYETFKKNVISLCGSVLQEEDCQSYLYEEVKT